METEGYANPIGYTGGVQAQNVSQASSHAQPFVTGTYTGEIKAESRQDNSDLYVTEKRVEIGQDHRAETGQTEIQS